MELPDDYLALIAPSRVVRTSIGEACRPRRHNAGRGRRSSGSNRRDATVDEEHKTVGFDRKIRISWLSATADWAAQGLSTAAIRTRLDRLLDVQVAGSGPHSARGKTMTVLTHVWVLVPDTLGQLRNDGLNLLDVRSGRDRLPLHWGMCLATYPFFRDVAETTGRLLALQGRATLLQIVRRTTESWGACSTVARATQRIVRSFVAESSLPRRKSWCPTVDWARGCWRPE